MFDLTGKVAVVTGGNGGIGLGYAEGLAEHGANVCIWGTNEDKNAAAVETLRGYGVEAEALRCDVSDEAQVVDAFAKTVERFGHVDSCFANAGVGGKGAKFDEMTQEEWQRVFSVNMDGVMYTFREAIKHMKAYGEGGSLVVTSSGTARFGAPGGEHYSATKAGVIALVQSLSVGQARHGIRANAIIPGWIETSMTERSFATEAFQTKVIRRIPQRRWGKPADFKAIAVYFASDESSYHTGDTISVDGGVSHA
ncbi:MAG: SDR family oxidoreductase [Chromatiales bacterium]|jgi:NAD(P)-dependent dehydrogenase (short-subunit alcohol dehydrogenase family)|nr:SDR family oxidoreductase [Chromatiales bacterium]